MHSSYPFFYSILAYLWFIWIPQSLWARPAAYQVNMREGCRQRIAGGYLKVYDEKERLRTYIRALDDQLKDLKPLIEQTRKADRKAAQALAKTSFEVDLAAKRLETGSYLKALETQHKESSELKEKAEKDYQKAVQEEARLRALIGTIFSFERTEDKPDGGYPIHLHYKSPCPKFRHLCPLPPKEARQLLAITFDDAVPEECQRYAGLSHSR